VRSPRSHCMILWVRLDLTSRADRHAIKLRVSAAGAIRNCTWPITMSNDLALQNAPIHRRPLDAVAEGGVSKELGPSWVRPQRPETLHQVRASAPSRKRQS
jgi:hypothetical protein